ncbi:unnamed protein product [Dovyalis caffra]|uniref:Uncharacterized protein n=1 Tax=Dovyalis caffra TaxID=77055 RepID=A0AAV1SGN2_9ROSI|nr:unnamed protein product [Dovyalis caffra]
MTHEKGSDVKRKQSTGSLSLSWTRWILVDEVPEKMHAKLIQKMQARSSNLHKSFYEVMGANNPTLYNLMRKYDKRTGGLLRLPFTQLALHQPFFTTEPPTRLVRECEDNLELLFPLEEEVVESISIVHDQSNPSPSQTVNTSPEPSSSLRKETVDIVAALLLPRKQYEVFKSQKASSTSNPLSFSSFFKSQDDESTGAVTAANSTSNSSATMQDGEEIGQEDEFRKLTGCNEFLCLWEQLPAELQCRTGSDGTESQKYVVDG